MGSTDTSDAGRRCIRARRGTGTTIDPATAGTKGRGVIKADKGTQLRLLDLQGVDTALAQLNHRRRTLPEHAVIAKLSADRAAADSDLVAADTAVSDLELAQTRAESDLEPVRERLRRNEKRVADGSISDSKALNAMVEEIGHLKKRIGDLEDAELEVMEQLETAVAARESVRARLAEVDATLGSMSAKRNFQLSELAAQIADRNAERAEITPGLPGPLIQLYDKIRTGHGGVGAAALTSRRCTGCQLELNSADLRGFAAAAEDEVLRCEECGRILVRTAESGI